MIQCPFLFSSFYVPNTTRKQWLTISVARETYNEMLDENKSGKEIDSAIIPPNVYVLTDDEAVNEDDFL